MKLIKLLLAALTITMSLAAQATVIDFTSETSGAKTNGYTVSGVQFFDTLGNDLSLQDWGHQSHGKALGVFSDDASMLRMVFSGVSNLLAIDFGNDDACCSQAGNVALLKLFLNGTQVGQTTVALNRNDLMDQTITLAGIDFNEAIFGYTNTSFNPINLIEIVDNITFAAAVPEPGSLLLLGLGAVGFAVSRRRRVQA